jgi:hypothetical protein
MMQNDKYVQDAAVDLNIFDILILIHNSEDETLIAKCVYMLTGLLYGDNLKIKLLFLEKFDGITLIYNMILKNKDRLPLFKRVLSILREMTKIEESDSPLNQIRLKCLLKVIELKLNELILTIINNSHINDEDNSFYLLNFEIREITYDILVNFCKSFSSIKEIFDVMIYFILFYILNQIKLNKIYLVLDEI